MFLTTKRFTALSLGTSAPEDSQNTRLTCVCRKEASSDTHALGSGRPPLSQPHRGLGDDDGPASRSTVRRPSSTASSLARETIHRETISIHRFIARAPRSSPRVVVDATPREFAATAMGESPSAGLLRAHRARVRDVERARAFECEDVRDHGLRPVCCDRWRDVSSASRLVSRVEKRRTSARAGVARGEPASRCECVGWFLPSLFVSILCVCVRAKGGVCTRGFMTGQNFDLISYKRHLRGGAERGFDELVFVDGSPHFCLLPSSSSIWYGLPESHVLRTVFAAVAVVVERRLTCACRTASPTLKRSFEEHLQSMKPLMRASLSRFLPMKTKRHSRSSSAPHLASTKPPEKSWKDEPWKTNFLYPC